MDIRTYPHDADSDVDAEQMTHFNLADELNARAAENERLRNELASIEEKFRVALGGYHDSNLLSLAESLRKFNEYHSDRIDDATEERDRLQDELDAERAQNKDMRKAIAKAIGIYVSDDKKTITIWDEDRLCINGGQTTEYYRHADARRPTPIRRSLTMDIRTYDKDSHKDRPADGAWLVTIEKRAFDALRAENERLTSELGQCASENNQLTENAVELGQALDLALAERDAAFAEVDALRAELDAMRRAHSVIAARMDAMGC